MNLSKGKSTVMAGIDGLPDHLPFADAQGLVDGKLRVSV